MTIGFRLVPHGLTGGTIVEILKDARVVGVIYPGPDGSGIKLVSAHFAGDLALGADFPIGITMDNGQGSHPPIPSVRIAFDPRPFTIEGDHIVRPRSR